MTTSIDEPRELFLDRLRAMLWVELKLAEDVLPELSDEVRSTDLRWALERHLGETETQVGRLRRVFTLLEEPADPEPSPALLGLVEEHARVSSTIAAERNDVADLFVADVLARGEHLEIGAYDALVSTATALGEDEVARLLQTSLEEERHAFEEVERAAARLLAEKVESPAA